MLPCLSKVARSFLVVKSPKDNVIVLKSQRCQVRIVLEHYRVFIQISPLNAKNPNYWYGIDVMAAYVSKTSPAKWIYNLPRGVPLYEVVDQQLKRWRNVLDQHFKTIMPIFFVSDENFEVIDKDLREFARNFYQERTRQAR